MALSQKELGRKLHDARKSVSLTQQQAADQIEISRETLAQIEVGSVLFFYHHQSFLYVLPASSKNRK